MRKYGAVLLLCASLAGCSNSKAQEFTPLPYHKEDNVFEVAGKTIINVPVWTLEGALVMAYFGAYLAAVSGYRR
jgi:hypothetical protein